jgi:hypothetical protein
MRRDGARVRTATMSNTITPMPLNRWTCCVVMHTLRDADRNNSHAAAESKKLKPEGIACRRGYLQRLARPFLGVQLMRMRRQAIMGMLHNAMEAFACLLARVDMNHHGRQVGKTVHELVSHFFGDGVSLGHRPMRTYGDIQLRVQAVAQPTGTHFRYLLDTFHMTGRFPNFIHDARLNTIEHPSKDSLAGLPDDADEQESDE